MQKTVDALGLKLLLLIIVGAFLALCSVIGLVGLSDSDSGASPSPGVLSDVNSFGPKIDAIPTYQPQSTCDPTPKPGVVAFRDLILKVFPGTGDDGISRACSAEDRISEHKE